MLIRDIPLPPQRLLKRIASNFNRFQLMPIIKDNMQPQCMLSLIIGIMLCPSTLEGLSRGGMEREYCDLKALFRQLSSLLECAHCN